MSIDWNSMRVMDLHSHWGTRRGYRLRTEAERAQQPKVWKSTAEYVTEHGTEVDHLTYGAGIDVGKARVDLAYDDAEDPALRRASVGVTFGVPSL